MKYLYYLLLIGLSLTCQSAYNQVSPNHQYPFSYSKIGKSSELVYTFSTTSNEKGNHLIRTFNFKGENTDSIFFDYKQYGALQSVTNVGKNTLFYFDFSYSKEVLFILVDENGHEVTRKQMEPAKTITAKVYGINDHQFAYVSNVKDKKPGIRVTAYNSDFTVAWQYENIPDKSRYFIEQSAINSKGEIAFIYNIKNDEKKLVFLNADGTLKSESPLQTEGLSSYRPYKMEYLTDTEIYLVGNTGKVGGQSIYDSEPTGLNLKVIDQNGTEKTNQNITFEGVHNEFGDRDLKGNLYQNKTAPIHILGVTKIDAAFYLIGESYQYISKEVTERSSSQAEPSKTSYKTLTLGNIYLMPIDHPLTDILKIWKPLRTVSFKGDSFLSALGACQILEENNLFGYLFTENQKVYYRGFSQNFEFINYAPINAGNGNIAKRKYFGRPLSDQPVRKNQAVTYEKSGPGGFYIKAAGIFNTPQGKLFYQYDRKTGYLQFSTIQFS